MKALTLTLVLLLSLTPGSATDVATNSKSSVQPTIITDPGGGGTTVKTVAVKADSWMEYTGIEASMMKRNGCSWDVYRNEYSGTTLINSTWLYPSVTYGSWVMLDRLSTPSCPRPV